MKTTYKKLKVGEEFWDHETGVRMIKIGENKFAIVLDENGHVIPKPKEQ